MTHLNIASLCRPQLASRGRSGRATRKALMAAWLAVMLALAASAQDESTQPTTAPEPADTAPATQSAAPTTAPEPTDTAPATQPAGIGAPAEPDQVIEAPAQPDQVLEDGQILLNFKDAPVQAVLTYLSQAAGLVILEGAHVDGRVTVLSRTPINTDEAVALLDTVLKEKGYAAIRTGRTLKIVTVAQAARENLPVHSGGDPDKVPLADRLVTQVIPIRYADVTRLRADLAPLVGSGATLTANQASNSLILIDTQTNIRRIMQIIRALDEHMAGVAEVKIYQLKYADATNTARLITELFSQNDRQRQAQGQRVFLPFAFGRRGDDRSRQPQQAGGRQQRVVASADQRTNTLVISAPPDLLKVIDGLVVELDSDPTEEQSVFVYPLKNAQAKNLETVLNQIFSETATAAGGRGGQRRTTGRSRSFFAAARQPSAAGAAAGDLAGQVYIVADEDTNSLLVRTATKYVERVKEILDELDRPIRQVLIKVLIAEVTHDDTFDLGTEFSVLNLRFGASGTFTLDLGGTADESQSGAITTTLDAGLSATFNALQEDGRLDVLSRPYILASDNQEASITVGQEVPFIRNSRTTETGQTINTIEYEDVGIILNVTPHVNPEGLVIMNVNPEISSVSETTVPISESVNATVYNKRSAQTQVAVQNGQTIVIGGLMEDRITESVRKVPGLGDIPLLGALFRRTYKRKIKTELLIFLTPRVAEQPASLDAITQDETAESKSIQGAGGPGAFAEHMEAMRRGATAGPEEDEDREEDEDKAQP